MKVNKLLSSIAVICLSILFTMLSLADDNTEICPGKGERCARVRVIGVGLWWMSKTPGGPAVIIREESADKDDDSK